MHVLFWKNGDCNVLLPRHSLCLELMHNIPQWKKKIINLDGIQGMLCYNASDIAFMGISSFWSNFLNTSHHLLINFKTGTEWKLKKKRKKKLRKQEKTLIHDSRQKLIGNWSFTHWIYQQLRVIFYFYYFISLFSLKCYYAK